MSAPFVELDKVAVRFPRDKHGSLKRAIIGRGGFGDSSGRWKPVLTGVSLRVDAPQRVGVVGRNGSGKTTLLRVIAGLLPPLEGTRRVSGSVASIISAGTGLDPMLSARENVRLAMAIGGRIGECDASRIAEILDFVELGAEADQKLATLSLGFQARLAFAISVFQKADIHLLDEAFSAGDFAFVAKARAAIRSKLANAHVSIVVSHVGSDLLETCDRGIWLRGGTIAADGSIGEVLRAYEAAGGD